MFKISKGVLIFIVIAIVFIMVAMPKDKPKQAPAIPQTHDEPKGPAPKVELTLKDKMRLRIDAARDFEDNALDKGMDMHVNVSGKNKDIITFRYVLISRPLVHKLGKDGELINRLRDLEFKKAIFTDGYDSSWTFDFSK